MRGIRFAGESQIEFVDLDMPVPGDHDVIVAIKCSGICGSDLIRFPLSAQAQGPMREIVPGHEGVGVVHQAGAGVTDVKVGDRVVVYFKLGCGECEYCVLGHTVHCKKLVSIGRDTTGTGADYVQIPSWAALPLPDDLTFADGTVLVCNLGTAFAAVANSELVRDGRTGAAHVYGAGPVGVCAALVAKAFGLTVTVSDLYAGRRDYAEQICGVATVDASDPAAEEQLAALTGGRGFDLVIETTGSTAGRASAIRNAAALSEVVLVGNGEATPAVPLGQVKDKQLRVRGSVIYRIQDYPAMIELCRRLPIRLSELAAAQYPVERAAEAFAQAISRDGGKVLLTRSESSDG